MSERVLDLSGLAPPEPFEQVVAALATLGPRDRLRVLFPREPVPLYTWLEDHDFAWRGQTSNTAAFEMLIWRRRKAAARARP